jgi:acetylornithine deacetylase
VSVGDEIALLRHLIAFDTTSAKSNQPLIAFVADYLLGHGVVPRVNANDDGTKASLIASIGPQVAGGVVLSGHTDTVPVAGQAWSSDPFALTDRHGRLYGRGTADMKGFIACALAAVPDLARRRLRVPIHLALSHDEEVGCLAAPALIAALLAQVPRPALAIVGEPSEMRIANAHRGIHAFITTVTGRPGHSSAPQAGVNAITHAALCVDFLRRLSEREAAAAEGRDSEATTINVGLIEGGTAVNIIAERCRIVWECRPAPASDPLAVARAFDAYVGEHVLAAMRARAPEASVITEPTVAVPPLVPEADSPAEALALALTGHNRCISVPFASEAGLFQQAGIPTVVCGPGSAAQAHQPDEFVTSEQLALCRAFLSRLAAWAGSNA